MSSAALAGLALAAMHLNTAEIRDLYWDGDLLWAATSGGVEVWDADGERVAHVTELPRASVQAIGRHRGQITLGLEWGGAATWDPSLGDWVALDLGDRPEDQQIAAVLDEHLVTYGGLIWPGGERLPGKIDDAVVSGRGELVAGSMKGELFVRGADGALSTHALPGPALDLGLDARGDVQIAAFFGRATWGEGLEVERAAATAAGDGLWGDAGGALTDALGALSHAPAEITAIARGTDDAVFVGTTDGLYLLDRDLRRLTSDGQICGDFVTGADVWRGQIVVSTFDRGACVLGDDGLWAPIPGLPTDLLNDLLVEGDDLWLATSAGLARFDGAETAALPASQGARLPRSQAATNHLGVTGLALGDRLWISDVVGPTSRDTRGSWRRHRYHVWGTSYQDAAACGGEAWFASEDAGVSWTNGRDWEHFDASTGLPDDWVMAVACQPGGIGWAGTYQDGLWAFDGRTWSELPGLPDEWVLSLERDPRGAAGAGSSLWVGTMGGLFYWDGADFSQLPSLPHPAVHELTAAGGLLLAGTEGGLAVYEVD